MYDRNQDQSRRENCRQYQVGQYAEVRTTLVAEPLDQEHGRRFAGIPNLVLTPHIAGVTQESNRRVSKVTADNVRRALQGMH